MHAGEHEHTVAEITKLVRHGVILLPGAADVPVVRFYPLAPPVATALDAPHQRREPLEVRGEKLVKLVEITPVVGVDRSLDDLHVLPRGRRLRKADGLEGALAVAMD